MLEELQSWWQTLTPETLAALQTGGTLVGVLLGGHILGGMVARRLRKHNFDAALRLPGSSPPGTTPEHGIGPTLVAGMLVRLTVWTAAAWWMAHKYGRPDLANTLSLVISRTWAVAAMLVTVLGLGSLLAHRLITCLEGPKGATEVHGLRNGSAAPHRSVAGAVGAAAYVLVTLLVLLMAADMFDWPLTRSSAQALWGLAHQLFIASSALLIGYLGARAARDLATSEGAASPEKRAGQFTAVAIVGATTVLAVGMLLASTGVLVGLVALGVLGVSIWLVRGYLPDVTAGLKLRTHKIEEVWFDGEPWQVADIGFLTSQVQRAGAVHRLQNRLVLEAGVKPAAQHKMAQSY